MVPIFTQQKEREGKGGEKGPVGRHVRHVRQVDHARERTMTSAGSSTALGPAPHLPASRCRQRSQGERQARSRTHRQAGRDVGEAGSAGRVSTCTIQVVRCKLHPCVRHQTSRAADAHTSRGQVRQARTLSHTHAPMLSSTHACMHASTRKRSFQRALSIRKVQETHRWLECHINVSSEFEAGIVVFCSAHSITLPHTLQIHEPESA